MQVIVMDNSSGRWQLIQRKHARTEAGAVRLAAELAHENPNRDVYYEYDGAPEGMFMKLRVTGPYKADRRHFNAKPVEDV